ncbi:single-stranded DNA-binding protein [Fusobacterium polymorphum]
MNLVVLNGRLTRDPELKFGQSGKAYSRFSIAVDRPFQSSSDKNSQTADFINCVAFGKTAEFIGEYFRKGRKILLNGKLQMSQYESEGKKITTYVVVVDSVEFGESKANSGASDTSSYGHSESKSTNNVMETPVFDDNSSDDMGTPAEIDDEFPF